MPSSPPYRLAGLLVAAGRGARLGGETPKQFLTLGDRSLLEHAAGALAHTPHLAELVVVVPDGWEEAARERLGARGGGLRHAFVVGGETRQESVARGLEAIANATHVVLHDAARPFASPALFERVVAAAVMHGAATAALPGRETLMREASKHETQAPELRFADAVVEREGMWSVQTPQAFELELLREAHRQARRATRRATDDGGLVQALGRPVALVPGEWMNLKITSAGDLDQARFLWKARDAASEEKRVIRIGQGYDVHAFETERPLVLGGVPIAHTRGLAGHSDADVLTHAVASALLGSLALGDLGTHFPPGDARWRGVSSLVLLQRVHAMVRERGFAVQNCDATVIAEAPRLAPHIDAMRQNLARVLEIEVDAVSVKATTSEKLGAIGRGEGIAAEAVIVVSRG
jgi:2-C-methyl-D-erythritol 4-phosphate cytidylyltransferase/2-C-methyl-D-erythritol 2,4-cyclodiphosphate synthase